MKFIKDKEDASNFIYVSDMLNVEHDEIIADSVKDAMEDFEYMIEDHIKDEIAYYEELLKKYKEKQMLSRDANYNMDTALNEINEKKLLLDVKIEMCFLIIVY